VAAALLLAPWLRARMNRRRSVCRVEETIRIPSKKAREGSRGRDYERRIGPCQRAATGLLGDFPAHSAPSAKCARSRVKSQSGARGLPATCAVLSPSRPCALGSVHLAASLSRRARASAPQPSARKTKQNLRLARLLTVLKGSRLLTAWSVATLAALSPSRQSAREGLQPNARK